MSPEVHVATIVRTHDARDTHDTLAIRGSEVAGEVVIATLAIALLLIAAVGQMAAYLGDALASRSKLLGGCE